MKATETRTFSYLIKQLPQPIAFVDQSFVVVAASNTWLDYGDFSQHDVIGKQIFELFDQQDSQDLKECLSNCLKGDPDYNVQIKLNGSRKEKWVKWVNLPWFDEEENIIGAMVQFEDITKKIRNEIRYEKIENLLQYHSEVANVGGWEYNVLTNNLFWSGKTKKIHEVPSNYIPNLDDAIAFYEPGHSQNTIGMLVHSAITKGEPWNRKLKLITAKGTKKWVISAGKPCFKKGQVTRILGTLQDVTDQIEQEEKTKESEQLLKTIIDNLPMKVYLKDAELKRVLVNKAAWKFYGMPNAKALLGKVDADLYEENSAFLSREEDLRIMKTKKPLLSKRTSVTKKDGSKSPILVSKIPLLDLHGNSKGIIGISIDITEMVQKEDQLRKLINVTAIQNKKLINFAHIVSHNLRSHSANFSMLLEFLSKEETKEEKDRIMEMLLKASNNLMETLENLNEAVEINTNINIEKKAVNLNHYITKVQEDLAVFLQQNKVKIKNTIPDQTMVKVVPAYLESIILNLLTNAVKYQHPARRPQITLSTKQEDQYQILEIADNGLGIDMAKHGHMLFGMYKTFHKNKDARGIGLYITKNQIEAMDGYIITESEVDKGSKFSVYIKNEN